MERTFLLLHLVGLALGLGGLVGQLVLLSRFRDAEDPEDRAGSERMSGILVATTQEPGTYLAAASGVGLLWARNWEPLSFGYLQFKLLFVFWVVIAARLMSINTRQFLVLRGQCGDADSDRLRALKDNHRMIGYVTVLAFLFILVFAVWKPL